MTALDEKKHPPFPRGERKSRRWKVTPNVKNRYSKYSLADLCRLISFNSNPMAMHELHDNRPVFRFGEEQMLLGSFLDRLRLSAQGLGWSNQKVAMEMASRAYDLTLDKFFNLPTPGEDDRTDCRHYFSAFLRKYDSWREANPSQGEIVSEHIAASFLQNLIVKHFRLSLKEAKRNLNPFWSRYRWQFHGKSINLMLPKSLEGHERRAWLEENIPDPDPYELGEQIRIQEIIDTQLSGERFVSLTDALERRTANPINAESEYIYDLSISLAANVAQEKADNIKAQRPAIRALGEQTLREMILTIFDNLADENYNQKEIAKRYGLSQGTTSRFAGQDWFQRGEMETVPDLWANTAKVISGNPNFRDFARQAGVDEAVSKISEVVQPANGKEARLG